MRSGRRLAIVVQRYATGITGGGEYHARRVAEGLAARGHDVTVLTSTSLDALAWKHELPEGESREGEIRVLRFRSQSVTARTMHRVSMSAKRLLRAGPIPLRQIWTVWGKPYVPGLITHLEEEGHRYDVVFFFTYRFFPSLAGAPITDSFRIGVPLGHDDDFFGTPPVRRMLRAFDGIIGNTEEELALVRRVRAREPFPSVIAGCGIDEPKEEWLSKPRPRTFPYVVYMGRQKDGTDHLAPGFQRFLAKYGDLEIELADGTRAHGRDVRFVLAGDHALAQLGIPSSEVSGHIGDEERWTLLRHAEVLINPSVYESLSLVLLEAWRAGIPVMVNAACEVTTNQTKRASGGVSFRDAESFADGLATLLRDASLRRKMAETGRAYVESRYRWPLVMEKYDEALSWLTQRKP